MVPFWHEKPPVSVDNKRMFRLARLQKSKLQRIAAARSLMSGGPMVDASKDKAGIKRFQKSKLTNIGTDNKVKLNKNYKVCR